MFSHTQDVVHGGAVFALTTGADARVDMRVADQVPQPEQDRHEYHGHHEQGHDQHQRQRPPVIGRQGQPPQANVGPANTEANQQSAHGPHYSAGIVRSKYFHAREQG